MKPARSCNFSFWGWVKAYTDISNYVVPVFWKMATEHSILINRITAPADEDAVATWDEKTLDPDLLFTNSTKNLCVWWVILSKINLNHWNFSKKWVLWKMSSLVLITPYLSLLYSNELCNHVAVRTKINYNTTLFFILGFTFHLCWYIRLKQERRQKGV